MTAPTPGTPAATDFPNDREMLALIGATRTDRDLRQLRESMREFVAAREAAAEQRGAEKALREAFAFMDRVFEIRPVESEFSKGFAYAMSGVLEHLDERAEAAGSAAVAGGS